MRTTRYLINLLGISTLITGFLLIIYTFAQIVISGGVLYYEPNQWILLIEVWLILFSIPVVYSHIKDVVINIYKEFNRENWHDRKEETTRG